MTIRNNVGRYKPAVIPSPALAGLVLLLAGGTALADSAALENGFELFVRDRACAVNVDKSADLQALCDGEVALNSLQLGTSLFDSQLRLGSMSALGHGAMFTLDLHRQQVYQRFRLFQGGGQSGGAAGAGGRGRFGLFASGQYAQSERDSTDQESGLESDLAAGLLGFDVNWTPRFMTGLAFGISQDEADIAGNGGKVDTEGYSATFYTSFAPTDSSYIGAYGAFTRFWYDTERNIRFGNLSERAVADALGQQLVIGLSGGYDWQRGPWSLGGYGHVDWAKSEVEQYSERGATLGLQYGDQNVYSVTSTLGMRGTYSHQTGWGVVVPELRLAWVHEYDNGSRSVDVQLAQGSGPIYTLRTDGPDTNYFRIGGGVTADVFDNASLFLDYERTAGHKHLDSWLLNGGVLVEF